MQTNITHILSSLFIFIGIVFFEMYLGDQAIKLNFHKFYVPTEVIEDLYINYEIDAPKERFHLTHKAPKILHTENKLALFQVFNSGYIGIDKNTQLNTLVFENKKFHFSLIKGAVLLDTQTESNEITLQVGNALVNSYKNGQFYIAKIDNQLFIHVLQGNAHIGIYDKDGLLKRTFLLSKFNKLETFDSFSVEGDLNIETLETNNQLLAELTARKLLPTVATRIKNSEIFTLKYKGQHIATKQNKFISQKISKLSFNENRKNFYSLYDFFYELNSLEELSRIRAITSSDLEKIRTVYSALISDPQLVRLVNNKLKDSYEYILAIRPNDNLFELKIYLDGIITGVAPAKRIISSLEDMYYLYSLSRSNLILRTYEKINTLAPQIGSEDSKSLITILDNLAEAVISANTKELFATRNILMANLNSTIDIVQFRLKSKQHLSRLKSSAQIIQKLDRQEVKASAENLIQTLDAASQKEYQQFLIEI